MAFIPTVSVTRPQQLIIGAYYVIKGTHGGRPLPPQVFYLQRRIPGKTLLDQEVVSGLIFWQMLGIRRCQPATLSLDEVNIPEHGDHDIHLERILDRVVQQLAKDESWKEVAQDIKRDLLRQQKYFGRNGHDPC